MKELLKYYKKYEEIINYLINGFLGVIVSVGTYSLFRYFRLSIVISNVLSWVIGVLFMYITNKIFVFKSKTKGKTDFVKEFFSFVVARVFTLIVETLILYFGSFLINDLICKIIAQVIIIILNYIISKFLVFKK